MTYLADAPLRIRLLPRNKAGYPVPWFATWIDGEPDFRVITQDKIDDALRFRLCWVCGGVLGAHSAFVIGPMCMVNRTSAEPPSHRDCAVFSARACPFLTVPGMRRRTTGIPEEAGAPGFMLRRNPGVALAWVTKRYSTFRAHAGGDGLLFDIGEPAETLWFAAGRSATRAEVLASVDSGLPSLRKMAEDEGPGAVADLEKQVSRAMGLVPA